MPEEAVRDACDARESSEARARREERADVTALARELAVLRRMPPSDPGAVDRVLAATVARGHRPGLARRASAGAFAGTFVGARWRIAAGLALAAALGGVAGRALLTPRGAPAVARGTADARDGSPDAAADPETVVLDGLVRSASTERSPDAPLATTFVLRRPDARQVALVGDFNAWDADATPLAPVGDGTWTVTVPLSPGRHGYAFVVDGERWVTDPRAPLASDADYGRDHSVVVVGAAP